MMGHCIKMYNATILKRLVQQILRLMVPTRMQPLLIVCIRGFKRLKRETSNFIFAQRQYYSLRSFLEEVKKSIGLFLFGYNMQYKQNKKVFLRRPVYLKKLSLGCNDPCEPYCRTGRAPTPMNVFMSICAPQH